MERVKMYCFQCREDVEFIQGTVVGQNGKKYDAYIHQTDTHELLEDKDLLDILIGDGNGKSF
jgi:hypothetical protein